MMPNQRADDLFILETLRHLRAYFDPPLSAGEERMLDDIDRCIKILEQRKEK